ncbi:response regulator [Alteraurantiacibacter aestuarii]|uniref:Response regulator n=1 Tax=Alteraurantiacibacter aestuarii TaxID=650004 RepID=A0A844ZLX7_9SPHN|nr:response regulator [Alteraurantiacibacter aestuarii]
MARKILVVEDDLLNRMFYHEVLQNRGFEVAMVSDGADVLDEVHRFEPDLITMDIQLPHISGLRLIRKLHRDEVTRAIPVLAITAFAGKGEEARIREAGAKGYLSKPVTIDKLLAEVDSLFAP